MEYRIAHALVACCLIVCLTSCQEQTGSDNGYDHLKKAYDLWYEMVVLNTDRGDLGYIAMPGKEFADDAAEVARQWRFAMANLANLESNGFVQHLERFAIAPEFRPPDEEWTTQPHYTQACGKTAQVLRARMVVGWEQRDWGKTTSSFELGIAISRRLLADDQSVYVMLGHAIHATLLDEASAIVLEGDVPSHVLQALGRSLDQAPRIDLLPIVESVRAMTRRQLDETYVNETELSQETLEDGFLDRFTGRPPGWHATATVESKTQTMDRVNEFIDRWSADHRAVSKGEPSSFDPHEFVEDLGEVRTIALINIVTVHGTLVSALRVKMATDALRLNLALAEFRILNGRYPDRLEQLISEQLAELPVDPQSGEPYGYFRRRPSVPAGRDLPYEIYSVGDDHTDNLGRFDWDRPGRAVRSVRIASFDRRLGLLIFDPLGYDYPLNPPN